MKEFWLDYRGQITSITALEGALHFVTVHPEGHQTGVYTLDPLKRSLACVAGPGFTHLIGENTTANSPIANCVGGVASVTNNALTIGKSIFELPSNGTCVAADSTGRWLVVGCDDGSVAVFHSEKGKTFTAQSSGKLHSNTVTAVVWEPEEPRFFSAGADNKLLSTHGRGELEPLNRSGSNGHSKPVRQLVIFEDRLFSAGDDGHIKVWERRSKRRPSTVKSSKGALCMVMVSVEGQPHLAVARADNTLGLYPYEKGKLSGKSLLFHDAISKAQRQLKQDATARLQALNTLASFDDKVSVALIAKSASSDSDLKLRAAALGLLASSSHKSALKPLTALMTDRVASIRQAALTACSAVLSGVKAQKKALNTGYEDVGVLAVGQLLKMANAEATAQLFEALNHRKEAVRLAVVAAFETMFPKTSHAVVFAQRSSHASTRRFAIIRALQRDLLSDADVIRVLRKALEDDDVDVRDAAYAVLIASDSVLCGRLCYEDADLARLLHGLRNFGVSKPKKHTRARKPKETPTKLSLLISAAASRKPDVSLKGASHLAALADGRAFGILLQLSMNSSVELRTKACKALATLGDQRAMSRLRTLLQDKNGQVRDAAFSAIERLLKKKPLDAVVAGLSSSEADVRLRALALLVKGLKKPTKASLALVDRALNDADATVRTNAFKAILAVEEPQKALARALGSVWVDVRNAALSEIMAEVRQDWAFKLLLQCFNDPQSALRDSAYKFAKKKGRTREPSPVLMAVASKHASMRLAAVNDLAKKVNDQAAAYLQNALSDRDVGVRTAALSALLTANITSAIVGALKSPHQDVRIQAAMTLAKAGDERAYDGLVEQITEQRPEVSDLRKSWTAQCLVALQGLSYLNDSRATNAVEGLLQYNEVQQAAGITLAQIADINTLKKHLKGPIAERAALGLAWRGESVADSLVFTKIVPVEHQVSAALAMEHFERLLSFLEKRKAKALALRVLILRCWADPEYPELLVSALPTQDVAIRLMVANVLSVFNDGDALEKLLHEQLFSVELELPKGALRQVALGVRYGEGMARVDVVRTIQAVSELAAKRRPAKELSEAFVREWQLCVQRYPSLLQVSDPGEAQPAHLQELVFGTFLALAGQMEVSSSIRTLAIRQMAKITDINTLTDVLLPAFSDSYGQVRTTAFSLIAEQPVAVQEALNTGHHDLGVLALRQLVASGEGDALVSVMTQRNDGLAYTAWTLFQETKADGAEIMGLKARYSVVRSHAFNALAAQYDSRREEVEACLNSEFEDVVSLAAYFLGRQKNELARPVLFTLLRSEDTCWAALEALGAAHYEGLGEALLLELTKEHASEVVLENSDEVLETVGELHQLSAAPALVSFARKAKKKPSYAVSALIEISGYGQNLRYNEANPDADDSWLEDLLPFHDQIFADALDVMAERNMSYELRYRWKGVVWAKTAVDAPVIRMLEHANDSIRHGAVQAYGKRVRFRGADHEPLLPLLKSKDALTSFFAAEALALAGHAQGISVLLAAIHTMPSLSERARAVTALGFLADERALDPLLRIAADPDHALIEAAAAALGHLHKTPKADEVLQLLLQLSKSEHFSTAAKALTGLRYFNSPTAWARIRKAAAPTERTRIVAAMELEFDPEDPSKCFTELLLQNNSFTAHTNVASAWRRRVGEEDLEPDYVLALCSNTLFDNTLERLRSRGEPSRLLEVAANPLCSQERASALLLTLFESKLSADELVLVLNRHAPSAVTIAARLLGRKKKLTAKEKKALSARAVDVVTTVHPEGLPASALSALWWACAKHGLAAGFVDHLNHPDAEVRQAAAAASRLSGDLALNTTLLSEGSAADRPLAARVLNKQPGVVLAVLDDPTAADVVFQAGAEIPEEAVLSLHQQGVVLPHLIERKNYKLISKALGSQEEMVRVGALEALGLVGEEGAEKALLAYAKDEQNHEEERKVAWRALRRSRRLRGARA